MARTSLHATFEHLQRPTLPTDDFSHVNFGYVVQMARYGQQT